MRALITGANRGIGAALHETLMAEGYDVTGTHRGDAREGWIILDVTDPDSLCDLAGAVDGPLDLLVCNAGVYLDKGEPLDMGFPAEMWAKTMAVNVAGVFLTIQALLPNLREAKGKVAVISSQMGSSTRAAGGSYIYRASKAAAVNLGVNLAIDLERDGIPVGVYHPGWVRTDMGGAGANISPEQSAGGLVKRFAELDLSTTGCFRTWDGYDYPF